MKEIIRKIITFPIGLILSLIEAVCFVVIIICFLFETLSKIATKILEWCSETIENMGGFGFGSSDKWHGE